MSFCVPLPLDKFGWMDERCFRPLLCTVKAELGRGQEGQPGLMIIITYYRHFRYNILTLGRGQPGLMR